jgi:hypothetical protein
MTQDVQTIRPAVISDKTAERLDALRRFRHLVRNVYTMSLDPEKMVDLVECLPITWSKLRAELMAFADFLERLVRDDESGHQ